MTTYKEYINPEVEFKVRQRGKKRKSNHRPLTVKEKTDPRRIKKLKQYQKPLDKHFLREQGPGAPPIPSPQDPKHFKEIPPRFAGGGKALRGLGRAFVKGGKV